MGFWRAVDWQRPWLDPYRTLGQAACVRLESGGSVAQALDGLAASQPIMPGIDAMRFVPHGALPAGESYEVFIARTASVPTRDNLHDLFNGLVWLRFPQLKRRLNELHADDIARHGVQSERGAVRDALTLFDENAALWQAPPVLAEALRRREWDALFISHRTMWTCSRPMLFGHALLEKLVHPRKAITAHLWLMPDVADAADAPSCFAAALTPALLAAKPYLPLPVLGVPGWWPPNVLPGFYDDAGVFRAPRG
jgi:hypothetical protein